MAWTGNFLSSRCARAVPALAAALALAACDRALPRYEFAFTRIGADGAAYAGDGRFDAHPWQCVRDDKTGLTWEVKGAAPGLHAGANTYSWFSRDEKANMGYEGRPGAGACSGSACDTESFVAAVNAEKLCGHSDWRIPGTAELSSLVDATVRFPGPTVSQDYFPNVRNGKEGYWTATAFDKHRSGAWAWRLDHGADFVAMKDEPRFAMAVRGEAKPAAGGAR